MRAHVCCFSGVQRARAVPLVTARGRTTPSGGKAGVALGRTGTIPQRPFHPRRIQNKHPMNGRGQTCTNPPSTYPTNAYDAGPPTADDAHDPAPLSQNAFRAHSTEKAKVDAACEVVASTRTQQEDTRRTFDQKCNETAVAETIYTNAMQDVLGKAEVLEM